MIIDLDNYRELERKRGKRIRVTVKGVDVTDRCFKVDTRRKVARLALRDYNGRAYLDDFGRIAKHDYRGARVEWV